MKFHAALPQGQANGLGPIVQPAVDEPHRTHLVLAFVDTKRLTTDVDTGDVEPTLRIRHIEVVLPADADVAEQLMRRAIESRSGKAMLPIETEDEVTELFKDLHVDWATGEVLDEPGGSDA